MQAIIKNLFLFVSVFVSLACSCNNPAYNQKSSVNKLVLHDYSMPKSEISKATTPLVTKISWGCIVVRENFDENKIYDATTSKDCILLPKGSKPWNWSLTNMHHNPGIGVCDVEKMLDAADIFILSRGMDLVLQVPQSTIDYLQVHKKEVHVLQTVEAVKLYNSMVLQGKRVAALIHSTC